MSFVSVGERASAASRWPDVYLASVARGVSVCGDFVAEIALVLALQARGAGGLAVAAVLLGGAVPVAVLAPFFGRLADRLDSRLLICTSTLAQSAVCVCLAFASGTAEIIALVGLLGVGLAVTSPTLAALLPSMVTSDDLPRASAIGQTANLVGMLVAPALGGLLVGEFGTRVPLLADAASYLVLGAAGLAIRTRRGNAARARRGAPAPEPGAATGGRPGEAPPVQPLADAGWSLRRDTLLWAQLVLYGAAFTVVTSVDVIVVFFVRGTLHGSSTLYGLISAVWMLGMVSGSWLLARLRGADGRLALAGLAQLGGLTLVGLVSSVVPRAEWLFPLWLLGGVCNGGLSVAMNVQLGRRIPEQSRGRSFAVFSAIVNGAAAIGYLLGGALLGVISPRAAIAGTEAAGLLAVLVFALPVVRAARRDEHECAQAHRVPPGNVQNHELNAAPPSRAHPVPELPADLLGPDALGRATRS